MRIYMTLNLKKKIIGIAVIATILPVAVILTLLIFQKTSLTNKILTEVDSLAKSSLAQTTIGIYNQCKLADEMIQFQLKHNLYIGNDLVKKRGSFGKSSESINWEPLNQETKTVGRMSLPKFTIGGTWFGQNKNPNVSTPFVDELANLGQSTVTVFQRMNEQGDMLRVATNVINDKGERAIGTFIPHVSSDGEKSKVIQSVLAGKTYSGNAFVVNKYYQTVYEPIRDGAGNVIGMLYIGISPESILTLRKSIMDLIIGKTGYVYVIYGNGIRKGYYVISKDGKRDGENIWNSKDAGGRLFIQDVVNHSVAATEGSVIYEYYPWKNKDEKEPRMKLAALMYYKPFEWVIGASTYEDEFRAAGDVVKAGINNMILWTTLLSIIIILIMIFVSILLGARIANPIINASRVMTIIAEGRLEEANSEINKMT